MKGNNKLGAALAIVGILTGLLVRQEDHRVGIRQRTRLCVDVH